ncbi:MAG: response regulator [Bacteroidota bacterium]|nr:MAG: response regulator [Bacteroidota bacterium]
MRVLVVDDNIIDRRLVKYTLQSHLNIVAETAKDGLEALNRIKCESFDLVITDIVMPKIEGIELINHIQSISPNTKIIAISGNNPYYLYIVKKLGIHSVFTKPLDINSFIERIESLFTQAEKNVVV